MAKFNVVQKRRRAALAEQKRVRHGNPTTGKLKIKPQPLSISGKRKRKLFNKWRREQKEAVEKGIVSMEDIEMAVADGNATLRSSSSKTFNLKKGLKVKKLKPKGKKNKSGKPAGTEAAVDAMVD